MPVDSARSSALGRPIAKSEFPPTKVPFRRDRHFAGGPLREIRPIGCAGERFDPTGLGATPWSGRDAQRKRRRHEAAGKRKAEASIHGYGFGSLTAGDGDARCELIPPPLQSVADGPISRLPSGDRTDHDEGAIDMRALDRSGGWHYGMLRRSFGLKRLRPVPALDKPSRNVIVMTRIRLYM